VPPVKPAAAPKPAAAIPAPAKPVLIKTAKAEAPLKSAPVQSKVPPATTKPAPPQPAAAKSVATKSVATKSVATKSVATKSPATKSPATKSPATKSPATKSAVPAKIKPVKKKTVATKIVKPAKKSAGASKSGAYTLLIGDFVPGQSFVAVEAKLKKSGITPVKINSISTTEPMKRIFIADFTDQDAADMELQKLKKLTADAFLVVDNGTYNLYAGSYFSESRLNTEVKRLTASGIKPVVKKAPIDIMVKVNRLTAGSFDSAEEAAKAVKRFKKQGLAAKLIKIGP
jgi:cell division protein FtsN